MENNIEAEDVSNKVEKEMLKEFKMNVADIVGPDDTDTILLKFLRAKNFNLQRSEIIFRECKNVKKVAKLETLHEIWTLPEVIKKYEFANYIGIAKDGTPIQYMAFGRGDFAGFVMSVDTYSISKYGATVLEHCIRRCKEQSKKLGKEIHSVTFVVDMECLSFRQILSPGVFELGLDLFRLLQDMYPEIWNHILIVNAPVYFPTIFNMVKHIFRQNFMRYIEVVSRDNTPDLLLKYIDAEVLPAFLGGKRLDSLGDPMCSEFMKFGDLIPEKYFLRNIYVPLQPTDPGVECYNLCPRRCYNYSFVAHDVDSLIRVEIQVEGGSLPLRLLYRKFGSDPENPEFPSKEEYIDEHDEKSNAVLVSPSLHLLAYLCPVNTFFFAQWPGIYIFKFDNSYNWITSRRITHRIRVLPPGSKLTD